jgi:aldehyde:ferredoxin oxidoreductase
MLETPLELGSGRVATLSAERLRAMVAGYYAERSLDEDGRPTREAEAALLLGG